MKADDYWQSSTNNWTIIYWNLDDEAGRQRSGQYKAYQLATKFPEGRLKKLSCARWNKLYLSANVMINWRLLQVNLHLHHTPAKRN